MVELQGNSCHAFSCFTSEHHNNTINDHLFYASVYVSSHKDNWQPSFSGEFGGG